MIMATAITTDPMLPQPYSVREVAKETPDTFTLRLEPENAANGAAFQPGQFSMLWAFGVGELPISISGDPGVARPLGLHGAFSRSGYSFAGEPASGRQRGCTRSVRGRLAGRGRAGPGRHHGGWAALGWRRCDR